MSKEYRLGKTIEFSGFPIDRIDVSLSKNGDGYEVVGYGPDIDYGSLKTINRGTIDFSRNELRDFLIKSHAYEDIIE